MTETKYDYNMKVVLLGDMGCGKTSLVRYFSTKQKCERQYISTIGVDFESRDFQSEGSLFKVQVWDIAGSEQFRSIMKAYYKDAGAIFILFDITDRHSFNNIEKYWWQQAKTNTRQEDVVLYMVGTKCDDFEKREIDKEVAQQLAAQLGMKYFECSSLTGENIEELFVSASKDYLETGPVKQVIIQRNIQQSIRRHSSSCRCGKNLHVQQKSKRTCC